MLKQQIVDITCQLIKLQTASHNPEINLEGLLWIKHYFDGIDLSIKEYVENETRSLLVTSQNPENIDILFHGHLDVVSAGEEQFSPRVSGDKLFGRGSLDMKGSLAVLLIFAKEYLAKTSHGLLITTDEELGGKNGVGYIANIKELKCKYFLTLEPTNLQLATEEKGAIWLTLKLKGKSAHASIPWLGKNPIWRVEELLGKLQKLYPAQTENAWVSTITPTKIETHNSQNQIPDELWVKLDCRYIPDDDPKKIINDLSKLADEVDIQLLEPPLKHIDHPYTRKLAILTGKAETKVQFASDARFYSELGIPAVIFGPTGENMHGNHEYVSIRSLIELYEMIKKFTKMD